MQGQSFEAALADSLAALDRGVAMADVLAAHPAHAEAIQTALALRADFAEARVEVPPSMGPRGAQRLRAALAEPVPSGGIPVLSSLSSLLPKAAAQALIALVVAGGAMGASAAAGGPNLPAAVLHAVGVTSDDDGSGDDVAATSASTPGNSPIAQAKATATGTPRAGDSGVRGLCQSFLSGGLGQRGQGTPESLQRLLVAANASSITDLEARTDAVEAFCRDLRGVSASPTATATAKPNPGRGKGPDAGSAAPEASGSSATDHGKPAGAGPEDRPEPGSGLGRAAEQRSESALSNNAPSSPPGLEHAPTTPGSAPESPPGLEHAPGAPEPKGR